MTHDLLLAVDGGQTSTESLLARRDGAVLGRGRGGPCAHWQSAEGAALSRTSIRDAIAGAYADADLAPGDLHAAVLAVTTVRRNTPEIASIASLTREIVRPGYLEVVPDYEANLAGASGGEGGVVVVAGGGAIAYGRSGDGTREGLAGGFGYLLGDPGSAWEIGRQAIIAAARASDGRDGPTALADLICEHFALSAVRDVTRHIYAADFRREQLSSLAPHVAELAGRGDEAARRIIVRAGEGLAELALAATRTVAEPEEEMIVFPTGGVFRAGSVLMEPFERAICAGRPRTEVRLPLLPPVAGALILALRLNGEDPDRHWIQRVQRDIADAAPNEGSGQNPVSWLSTSSPAQTSGVGSPAGVPK